MNQNFFVQGPRSGQLNNIRQIVHIGVPYTMEEYCQEMGKPGRDGHPAKADIYFN